MLHKVDTQRESHHCQDKALQLHFQEEHTSTDTPASAVRYLTAGQCNSARPMHGMHTVMASS